MLGKSKVALSFASVILELSVVYTGSTACNSYSVPNVEEHGFGKKSLSLLVSSIVNTGTFRAMYF